MENLSKGRAKIPDLLLEQWRLNELPDSKKHQLEDEFSRQRIEQELVQLEAEEKAFSDQRLAEKPRFMQADVAIPIAPKQPIPRVPILSLRNFLYPLAVAACAMFALFAGFQTKKITTMDDIQLKGDARPLLIYEKVSIGHKLLHDGDRLLSGSTIQLVYKAEDYSHGIIISLDGRGGISWHFPTEATGDQKLDKGLQKPLAKSFKLDEAPAFERFYFIRAHAPIPVKEVLKSLRQSSPGDSFGPSTLALEKQYHQFSILLKK